MNLPDDILAVDDDEFDECVIYVLKIGGVVPVTINGIVNMILAFGNIIPCPPEEYEHIVDSLFVRAKESVDRMVKLGLVAVETCWWRVEYSESGKSPEIGYKYLGVLDALARNGK